FSIQQKICGKWIDPTLKTCREGWEAKIINHQQELAVSLCSDQPWLQVYSGEKLNRRGLAIEPMSCPPNAFNSGIDLLLLKPKQQHILFFNICGECI
ncbi:aldose epimerase, partial [Salmonella enterica subsp. enterica serovar Derby]|nr:aldose epimerase [Salmonella enterica subsp. enterica serovar Derby]